MAENRYVLDTQLDMLKIELAQIEGAVRQLDEMSKNVKNWAIITWTASVGLALKDPNLHSFIWLTALIAILFWILDGSFRRNQRSFISRTQQISQFVNSEEFRIAIEAGTPFVFPLLIMRHHSQEFKNKLIGAMLFRTVSLLYLGLIVCSFIIWCIAIMS